MPASHAGTFCPRCSFAAALDVARPPVGDEPIPGYEMLHEIGRGAMGVVWLARERRLDRLVAVKVVAQAGNAGQTQRLEREARAAAGLRHPNIVTVHAIGGSGPSAYLAMDYIEGMNLDEFLAGKPLPARQAVEMMAKLADALDHAHRAGVVHRDIKPSNILIDEAQEPRLADFGLAGPLQGAGDLTLPGAMLGTPAYLAPEMARGESAGTVQSDLYGLGAVFYACLTGRPPFTGATAAEVLTRVTQDDAVRPRLLHPHVPRDLETICLKCLEKAPAARYADAGALRADLAAFLEGRPISARPVGAAGRLWRLARRHPAPAAISGIAALALLALAIGGPLMAVRIERERRAAVAAQSRAEAAEAATRERLRESLLARSRATRLAAGKGQRDEALAAATEAAEIRPGLDARNEAIAALARPELSVVRSWSFSNPHLGTEEFDPDHDRYAVETNPGELQLRSVADNALVQTWRGSRSKIMAGPTFSRDGRWAVARNASGQTVVWRDDGADPRFALKGRPYVLGTHFVGYGRPDGFSPDGRLLASATDRAGVSLHATADGRELRRWDLPAVATHVAFSPDGRWLAVGRGLSSRDGSATMFLRVIDWRTGANFDYPGISYFQSFVWGGGSDRIALSSEPELRVLSVPPNPDRTHVISDPRSIRVYFGPQDDTLLDEAGSGLVTLWDVNSSRPLLTEPLGADPTMAVSRDGATILKGVGPDAARQYRVELSPVVRTYPAGDERHSVLSAASSVVDYSPDGRWIAVALWGEIQLRDGGGVRRAARRVGGTSNYCSARFAGDGRSLLVASLEFGLQRYPIAAGTDGDMRIGPPQTLDSEPQYFIADVSPDGDDAILTDFVGGRVKIVPLRRPGPAVRWTVPRAAGAAFVDDRRVLVNSLDTDSRFHVALCDVRTGAVLQRLPAAVGAHVHVDRGRRFAVVGAGPHSTVILRLPGWSAGPGLPSEVQGREVQPAISPDGQCIAFAADTDVTLVDARTGSVLAALRSPQGGTYVPGLTFSPDGTRLALLWETGQLTVWDLARLRRALAGRGLAW
ncbi:MAG TPA: protein kinase [Opitutaceae bacterium]|nr:protein kinase [Opitutaceae bacterium]